MATENNIAENVTICQVHGSQTVYPSVSETDSHESAVRYFKISKVSVTLNLFLKKIVNKTFYDNSFYLCMAVITNIFFTIHPNTVYMI